MGKPKRPALGAQPPEASPRLHANPDQYGSSSPVWRLRLMETAPDAPWTWHGISPEDMMEVHQRLSGMETMRVAALHQTDSHAVEVFRLERSARDRLLEIKRDDLDSLYSLRISGRKRVWAIQDRHIFSLLWWDPEHQVCLSKLKHT